MNKIHSIIAAVIALTSLLTAIHASAQYTASGYYADGYLYRHEMNPAIGNDQNYVAMPGISNVIIGTRGDLGLGKVLFNRNGKTTTFLNPDVETAEFMSGIKSKNRLTTDVKLQVLGFGFKGFKGYNHVSINSRADVGVVIPGALFSLAKEGVENKTYDITNVQAHANAFAEISFGHSHRINRHLDIGATVKFLVGAGHADAEFEKAQLTLEGDQWNAVTNGQLQASVKGLYYKEETTMRGPEGAQTPHTYVSGIDIDKSGISGFGAAVDLGAVYRLNDSWTLSAALLDLGFIKWNNNVVASTNGERTFTTDAYLFSIDKEADNKFEREMDRMGEGLAALYELDNNGDMGQRTTKLASTVNLGAEYTLPSYRNLSFGLLGTSRFNGDLSWMDIRLSANWKIKKVLSLGVNVSAGTFGTGLGWIFNFHPTGFNFFLASDYTLGKYAKQGAPLSSNSHMNLGINFPF